MPKSLAAFGSAPARISDSATATSFQWAAHEKRRRSVVRPGVHVGALAQQRLNALSILGPHRIDQAAIALSCRARRQGGRRHDEAPQSRSAACLTIVHCWQVIARAALAPRPARCPTIIRAAGRSGGDEPGDLSSDSRSVRLRIAEVEACPHPGIVDLRDHVLESPVVARLTGRQAVDREAEATWTEEALQCFGDGRRVTGMR